MRHSHSLSVGAAVALACILTASVLAQRGAEDSTAYFRKWLQEDVVYIITEPERAVFLGLSTDEERERFIEQFWERRNPNRGAPENIFKEEHYRRIQFANERFASGRPGWRTDRGRIYVKYGEPDGMERRPTGGGYTRPITEGGGTTTVHPFEVWRYRYIEGVGQNVEIEFVDASRTGDYRIATSPQQKDALTMVPRAGMTEYEEMGLETRADRLTREGLATTYPGPMKDQPFERLAQLGALTRPPAFKFNELREIVETSVSYAQLPMRVATHHLRIGEGRALVSVAVEVANSDLRFATLGSVHRAEIQVYGRVSDLTGRILSEFEDSVHAEHTDERHKQALLQKSLYQQYLTLPPGNYKLELALRDPESKVLGTSVERISVPAAPSAGLHCSPVLLASRIEEVSRLSTGVESFAMGGLKIIPNVTASFRKGDIVGAYLHVYGAAFDQATSRPSLSVRYHLMQGQRMVRPPLIDEEGNSIHFVSDRRIVLVSGVMTDNLDPGSYRLLIRVHDKVSNQETTVDARFTVSN